MYNRDGMPQILDDMDTCIVESNFTGLKGFAKLFHDSRFFKALGHTLLFTVISVAIELVIGMILEMCIRDSFYCNHPVTPKCGRLMPSVV